MDPNERCTREVARRMIKHLDEKHSRKLRRFRDEDRNHHSQVRTGGKGVAEAYSPPRMVQVAGEFGLKPQRSLDMTVLDRDDGQSWNFNEEDKRRKAVQLLNKDDPDILMLGPTCAPFSSLNIGWNYNRMKIESAQNMIEDGMRHLAFAAELSIHQSKRGDISR